MQRWLFLLSFFMAFPVFAAETAPEDEIDLLAPEEEIIEDTMVQEQQVLPSCQDEKLLRQVQSMLEEYHQKHPVHSIYEKRQRALQMRFTQKYDEVSVSGFTAKQNREVADKLLMTKINNALNDEDIRLCKSDVVHTKFKPIYLMIYNHQGHTELHILNFLNNTSEDLNTAVVY